jgi:hypothetical protein
VVQHKYIIAKFSSSLSAEGADILGRAVVDVAYIILRCSGMGLTKLNFKEV